METSNPEKRAEAHAFLSRNTVGVVATISPEGAPRARSVYYSVDEDFNIYFMTFANTRKVGDLLEHPVAAFVVSDVDQPATIQIEGTVIDQSEATVMDPGVQKLADAFFARGDQFAPLTHFDPAAVRFYKLSPTWIRWGDFEFGSRTKDVLTEIAP